MLIHEKLTEMSHLSLSLCSVQCCSRSWHKCIIDNNGLKSGDENEILEIKNIYERSGVIEFAKNEIEKYTSRADKNLNSIPDGDLKERLKWFSSMLMSRKF